MTSSTPKICDHCGAKIVEHKHVLGEGLARALRKFAQHAQDGPIKLDEVGLSYSERCNFQKLRYWGLVAGVVREDGTRASGYWSLTESGRTFVLGASLEPSAVWTFRGNPVRTEGRLVTIGEVDPQWFRTHDDYAADAVAHHIEEAS